MSEHIGKCRFFCAKSVIDSVIESVDSISKLADFTSDFIKVGRLSELNMSPSYLYDIRMNLLGM